jgi:DNA-directed RNA polymerase beta subunit
MRGVGGYFIANGLERVIFWSEMLRINRFNCNRDSKNNTSFCYITADTPRGTLVTTLIEKKQKQTNLSPIHIMVSGRARKKFSQKKSSERTINILTLLQYYVALNQDVLGDEFDTVNSWFEQPYLFLDLIKKFVRPEHQSVIETNFADTIFEYQQQTEDVVRKFLTDIIREGEKPIKPVKKRGVKGVVESSQPAAPSVITDDMILELANSAILPHISSEQPKRKILTVAMMIAMTLEHMAGIRANTEKDHWENKRLVAPSKRCEQLMRTALRKYVNDIYSKIEERLDKIPRKPSESDITQIVNDISNVINSGGPITSEFQTAFTSPKFGTQNTSTKAKNPVQMLQSKTHVEKITMVCRTEAPIDRKTRSTSVRAVQPNQWGYLCIGKATENSAVGITKSKATTCQVTVNVDSTTIVEILNGNLSVAYDGNDDVRMEDYLDSENGSPVMLNAEFVGWTANGAELANILRAARREGTIDRHACIVHDEHNYIHIHTDEGRLVRPLLIVDDDGIIEVDKKNLWGTLDDADPIGTLFDNSCIEYIDAWEQDYIRIAVSEKEIADWRADLAKAIEANNGEEIEYLRDNRFTHLELNCESLFGVGLSTMPFPEFEQGPRVSYESQMVKQKLGTPHTNRYERFDDDAKYMVMPSRPLVTVRSERMMFLDKYPNGKMLQIQFNNIDGDTQEDSTMLSEEAAKLLGISHYFVFDNTYSLNSDSLCLPPDELIGSRFEQGDSNDMAKAINREKSRYRFICDNGLPMINAPLSPGDYILGKITAVDNNEVLPTSGTLVVQKVKGLSAHKSYKNSSVYLDIGQYGIVDGVRVIETDKTRVLIRLRRDRPFKVADKIESRYAQKATASHLLPKWKLPFDEMTGETADVTMNTHGIPKRMTLGYVLEVLYSIRCALMGQRYNGSCFEHHDPDKAYELIHKMGFDPQGYRWMVDPETGERYKSMVFMGPIQICSLTHLGEEKLQIRSTGIVKILTRQPPRHSRHGARRLGEMERNTILYHGCVKFLIDLMINKSDAYTVIFCKTCGYFAILKVLGSNTVASCPMCDGAGRDYKIVRFTVPYVFKFLTQLMFGAGILIYLDFSDLVEGGKRVQDVIGDGEKEDHDEEDQDEDHDEEEEEEEEEDEDQDGEEEEEDNDPMNKVQDEEDQEQYEEIDEAELFDDIDDAGDEVDV